MAGMIHRFHPGNRAAKQAGAFLVILAATSGVGRIARASDTQYKIKNNFAKVERTIMYLTRVESYRFHDDIVISSTDKPIISKTKIPDAGTYWVKEQKIFLIVFTNHCLKSCTAKELQILSAHELCHGIIHNSRMIGGETVDNNRDDLDADHCAFELLNRYKSEVNSIWRTK